MKALCNNRFYSKLGPMAEHLKNMVAAMKAIGEVDANFRIPAELEKDAATSAKSATHCVIVTLVTSMVVQFIPGEPAPALRRKKMRDLTTMLRNKIGHNV